MGTPLRFRPLERSGLLGLEVPVATTRVSRLLGLTLLRRERAGGGLLIPRCSSVHTFGMRFPLDLVFLDLELHQISVRRGVPPGRIAFERRAQAVLELPAGEPRPPEGA